MRVVHWNPEVLNTLEPNAMERLRKAAEVVASAARTNCPIGTVSRPIYKTGPYAGQPWTARDAGALKKTIRVVEKFDPDGSMLAEGRNVRIYAGNYNVYYAKVVEYAGKRFLRPALTQSRAAIKSILENG